MDQARRVIIRDKHPVLEPAIFMRPLNRLAIATAIGSFAVQIAALLQVVTGHGKNLGWFDHTALAVVALLWWLMGILVFLQRRAHRTGQLFLMSAAAGAAFLSLGSLYNTGRANSVLFSLGLLLFAPLLVLFTRVYSQNRPFHLLELLVLLPALLLVAPAADSLVRGKTTVWWQLTMLVIAGYLLLAITQGLFDLLIAKEPEDASQSRALVFGLVAGSALGIGAFVWPLVVTGSLTVGTSVLAPIVLLFLIAMSYAVLLFEFSEADLIVRRGVVYGFLTLIILVVYGALGAFLNASRASVTGLGGGISFVAVTVLIGAAFSPLHRQGRRFVDWLFYGRRADRWTLLQALSARLGTVMQPEDLSRTLVGELTRALHLQGAFMLRARDDGTLVLWHSFRHSGRSIPPDLTLQAPCVADALGDPAEPLLLIHARPLVLTRQESVPERFRCLDQFQVALAIPFVTRGGLEALLCLQPKRAHDAFGGDDLELLAPVMRQAISAFDNALLFSRLQSKLEELRRAYLRISQEQEAERARLARELHDGTAQELASLITLAAVAERQLAEVGPAAHTLDRLKSQAEEAYQGVRRASHALHPPMLDDFGLAPALAHFLEQFSERTGIAVETSVGDLGMLPGDVELAIFRVAQECMENVRKHSGASSAIVEIRQQGSELRMVIVDSGRGLPDAASRGIGLVGMRERVEAVGGTLRITGDRGVRVEAIVPLSSDDSLAATKFRPPADVAQGFSPAAVSPSSPLQTQHSSYADAETSGLAIISGEREPVL